MGMVGPAFFAAAWPVAADGASARAGFHEEIVVTATLAEESPFDLPYSAETLSGRELQQRKLVRTLPEALAETPGVMVQKTAHGQGSPILRGFTGFRTLFLIDGIRLNNSVFRDGPNQYWGTVDPWSLERLEIVRGPGSALYGSDAVGGTVSAITPEPVGTGVTYRVFSRFATAEESAAGRIEVSRSGRLSFNLGGSLKDFGDLRAGDGAGRQPRTAYGEWEGDLKAIYHTSPSRSWIAAHQRVRLDDAWRTHRTVFGTPWHGTTTGTDKIHALDQERELTYLQYQQTDPGRFFHSLSASFSFQRQAERLHRVRADDRSERSGFAVDTIGAWLRFTKATALGSWTWGAEYYHDDVDSYSQRFRADGSLDRVGIQGPVADEASYDMWGAYLQDQVELGARTELLAGARLSGAWARAGRVQEPRGVGAIEVRDQWSQLAGNLRALYRIDADGDWRLFAGASQGFRAPNLSDLTRFDSARSSEIETPAPGLRPEDFVSYELGLKARRETWSGELALFHTRISDLIIRTPTGRLIEGQHEVTKRNSGRGFVRGFELGGERYWSKSLSSFGSVSWLDGEVDGFPTSEGDRRREPLDRLSPLVVHLGFLWNDTSGRQWLEVVGTSVARQTKLSARDREDTDRIPPGGTPGYALFGVRTGWQISDRLTLSAALENVGDVAYRVHGSGVNGAGRNLVVAVRTEL